MEIVASRYTRALSSSLGLRANIGLGIASKIPNVRGVLGMSELSPGVTYEIVYVVKLTKSSSGWEHPINLRLIVPGGETKIRQVSLLMDPIGEWFELNLGSFQAKDGETGHLNFDIFEHGGHWKNGLIVKSAIIRPKH
uniref:Uncharacterized protein n=1 Tax=Chenopodium quinoa TaxID=63459 RepID=A0A803MSG1_CHEQI